MPPNNYLKKKKSLIGVVAQKKSTKTSFQDWVDIRQLIWFIIFERNLEGFCPVLKLKLLGKKNMR